MFGTWYSSILLTLQHQIVSPEIINLIFWWIRTHFIVHGCSQSNYPLIHLVGIHSSYLIYFHVCNMLQILHNRNNLNRSIFDFLKIFGLPSGSSLSSFSKKNTWSSFLWRMCSQNTQLDRVLLVWILEKYGRLSSEQTTLDCLSKLYQLFIWFHDDACCSQRLPWHLVLWLVKIDLQVLRNIDTYMSLPYTY